MIDNTTQAPASPSASPSAADAFMDNVYASGAANAHRGATDGEVMLETHGVLLMICVLLFNVVSRVAGKALAKRMTAE